MRKGATITVKLGTSIEVPDAEIAAFVTEALECWGGQPRLDDPLFSWDYDIYQ